MAETPPTGRRQQAVRNDERILEAAHEIFTADPTAPIAAVAARAGVGISALYRRYGSKENLLGTLCEAGQDVYIAAAERALAEPEPVAAYAAFLAEVVAEDTHARSARLAGLFEPTARHLANAVRIRTLGETLFARAQQAGGVRAEATPLDVALLLEAISSVRTADRTRTDELRRRLLAVSWDGLRAAGEPLPGAPLTWQEQESRWLPDHP